MKSKEEYIQNKLSCLHRDTRDLYRTTLTQREAEDGWCDIIRFEMEFEGDLSGFQLTTVNSIKYEFAWRMDMMGMPFHNIAKTIAVIESFANPLRLGGD